MLGYYAKDPLKYMPGIPTGQLLTLPYMHLVGPRLGCIPVHLPRPMISVASCVSGAARRLRLMPPRINTSHSGYNGCKPSFRLRVRVAVVVG